MTTESKHTPGPWRVNPKAATNVEAGGRGVVASGGYCDNTSDGAYAAENETNARLIAASPDMLAALMPFADIGISENPDYQPMIRMDRAAIVSARAAIAKARGQA